MEQKLKIHFIRFVTLFTIALLFISLIIDFLDKDYSLLFFNLSRLFITTFLFTITLIYPTRKWVPFTTPILMFFFFVLSGEWALQTEGELPLGSIILFPVYTFFFMGKKWGGILSAVMGGWVIVTSLLIHPHVFHNSSKIIPPQFPYIYGLSVTLCFALESIRLKLMNNLRFLTSNDELTGLLNRVGFLKRVSRLIDQKDEFAISMIDLDYFTKLNTSLGNKLCNQILKESAEALKDLEVIDAARWYGDQFVFIHKGSLKDLYSKLGKLQEWIKSIPHLIEMDFPLSFCTGIIEYKGCFSQEELMANVSVALLEAKTEGNGQIHLYNENDIVKHKRALKIQYDLTSAITQGDLDVHFQPKIEPKTSKIVGMEALSRWIHPELGYIIPPEFIDAAEKGNLICQLGEYVLIKSLLHIKSCFDLGYTGLTVSVNISPLHLLHSDFLNRMVAICEEYDVPTSSVFLEITENMLVREEINDLLHSLQRVGFKLSLDDFGTGFSSLSYLSSFRFDELKIDKSFTDKLLASKRDRDLFTMIVQLSNRFNMKTVVEGLETEEQKILVDTLGIDEIQGWYYSKALPASEFLDYLQSFH